LSAYRADEQLGSESLCFAFGFQVLGIVLELSSWPELDVCVVAEFAEGSAERFRAP
jgi:hypothetical protein